MAHVGTLRSLDVGYRASAHEGVEFLGWALTRDPEMAIIMLTGLDIPEVAIECIDDGARNYLVKPVETEFLRLALRDALAMRKVLVERNQLADGT